MSKPTAQDPAAFWADAFHHGLANSPLSLLPTEDLYAASVPELLSVTKVDLLQPLKSFSACPDAPSAQQFFHSSPGTFSASSSASSCSSSSGVGSFSPALSASRQQYRRPPHAMPSSPTDVRSSVAGTQAQSGALYFPQSLLHTGFDDLELGEVPHDTEVIPSRNDLELGFLLAQQQSSMQLAGEETDFPLPSSGAKLSASSSTAACSASSAMYNNNYLSGESSLHLNASQAKCAPHSSIESAATQSHSTSSRPQQLFAAQSAADLAPPQPHHLYAAHTAAANLVPQSRQHTLSTTNASVPTSAPSVPAVAPVKKRGRTRATSAAAAPCAGNNAGEEKRTTSKRKYNKKASGTGTGTGTGATKRKTRARLDPSNDLASACDLSPAQSATDGSASTSFSGADTAAASVNTAGGGGKRGKGGSLPPAEKQRRQTHNATEQRRRQKINTCIDEIRSLCGDRAKALTNKAMILSTGAVYMRELLEEVQALRQEVIQLRQAQ
mmetsp:Transcript_29073/g.73083  ORF Transcript_29073/g.73083 Transcript_29073/m.73083 type:complete len:497 (+) Transcript_29073:322-1812(+)